RLHDLTQLGKPLTPALRIETAAVDQGRHARGHFGMAKRRAREVSRETDSCRNGEAGVDKVRQSGRLPAAKRRIAGVDEVAPPSSYIGHSGQQRAHQTFAHRAAPTSTHRVDCDPYLVKMSVRDSRLRCRRPALFEGGMPDAP